MFSRISTIAFLTLPLLAVATPLEVRGGGGGESQCNGGTAQCCNGSGTDTNPEVASILGLLGIVAQGLVGLGCSPIAGNGCSASSFCCTDTSYGNLISLGCSPITL
ncbi:fungal hydrophobin [Amylocystis lapponica]|nr:fungal hydrophobin [Amylocystis lapponica]